MYGYRPAYFPQGTTTQNEGGIHEKDFSEVIFGSKNSLALYGFLKTYFRMVTILNEFVKDDDDDDDFGYHHRDNMIALFKQD